MPPDPLHAVQGLVHLAVVSQAGGGGPVMDRCLAELSGGDLPDWDRTVERVLTDGLVADVETAWSRGWQPADLLRLTERRLGDGYEVVVLRAVMAAQLARYAPVTLDPRWAGQLTDGGVEVWWSPDRTAVGACMDVVREGRHVVVGAAVRLRHLLVLLPHLEPIGSMPGQAPPPTAKARPAVDERILGRVRALLAKAESTNFPAEAETFTTAAQAMMARHSIDHALLAASGAAPADGPDARRIWIDNPYEGPKVHLLDGIAAANRCRTVWHKRLGFVTVVGHAADLDTVDLLFSSLLVQATAAMTLEGPRTDGWGRSRTRSFRQSFLMAYAARIRERLAQAAQEQTDAVSAETGSSTLLPVLAARTDAVEERFSALFPQTARTSVTRATDAEGWNVGRAAADLAALGTGAAVTS